MTVKLVGTDGGQRPTEQISADGENRPKVAFAADGGLLVSWTRPLGKPYSGAIRLLVPTMDSGFLLR
jgi:hypothetical protein